MFAFILVKTSASEGQRLLPPLCEHVSSDIRDEKDGPRLGSTGVREQSTQNTKAL